MTEPGASSPAGAVARELTALAGGGGTGVVTPGAPETLAILRAITPVSSPLFVGGGGCHRTLRALVRRQLDAELRATAGGARGPQTTSVLTRARRSHGTSAARPNQSPVQPGLCR